MKLLFCRKASSETRQAIAAEGKNAYLLSPPNREEPSALPVNVTMYLSNSV
jgi:hypothetical protein